MQPSIPVQSPPGNAEMLLRKSILRTLAYFDMFSYPMTIAEIRLFLDRTVSDEQLRLVLSKLVSGGIVFSIDEFFLLREQASFVTARRNGNARAESLLKRARKISAFLYWFPYVRGIGISGSLSKNVASKDADIDFFIITTSNRLWIARTFMHLFKKLSFLVGKQHWFCMNYYVDEHALQISEQNIFTATEVVTLLPTAGNGILTRFFRENDWVTQYFPNQPIKSGSPVLIKEAFIKRSIEYCFNNRFGEKLDDLLMKLTTRRWMQKEQTGKRNARGGRMGLHTGKHFARPNPAFFQRKILLRYSAKMDEVERMG